LGSIVSPGTYTKVTVDAAGLVTVGGSISLIDVTTALGYTPVSTTSGTTNFLPKYYAVTSLTPSQVSDDGVTITMGTVANATLRVNGGTASMYIGQLSDSIGYSGLAISSGISTSNFCLAANITTGTIINANATKAVFFNVGNVNYASVTSSGIAASNISATPTANFISKADANGTLDSWAKKGKIYIPFYSGANFTTPYSFVLGSKMLNFSTSFGALPDALSYGYNQWYLTFVIVIATNNWTLQLNNYTDSELVTSVTLTPGINALRIFLPLGSSAGQLKPADKLYYITLTPIAGGTTCSLGSVDIVGTP